LSFSWESLISKKISAAPQRAVPTQKKRRFFCVIAIIGSITDILKSASVFLESFFEAFQKNACVSDSGVVLFSGLQLKDGPLSAFARHEHPLERKEYDGFNQSAQPELSEA
jgi:hypothetical protein